MFGFFHWIKMQVKNSVVAGVNEALAELNEQETDSPEVFTLPAPRLALPAPSMNGKHEKKKSGAQS